jgi:tetratricopeptide (TPR) repeat protein
MSKLVHDRGERKATTIAQRPGSRQGLGAMQRTRPLAVVLLAVLVGACSGDEDKPARRGAPAPAKTPPAEAKRGADGPEAQPSQAPGVQADGSIVFAVSWFEGSLEEALARAKQEGKLVFADVGAYWCPPCHDLDEQVFVDPQVGELLAKGYVAVHIDAEKGEGPELVERYKVQAYPTLLVLEPSGVEKGRLVDFHAKDELLTALGRIAAGENVLAELEAAVESDPDDLEKRYELAHAYALAAKRDLAEPLFDAVLTADPKNNLGLASKVLYDRAMFFTHKLRGKRERAIEEYRELQRRFPESPQAVRAYRQIGRLLNDMGRPDDAMVSLDKMIATDPTDVGLKSSYGWFSFRHKCRPQAGLKVVDAGIEQEPDDAGLYYLKAELEHQLENHTGALAAIKKASELEPESAYFKRQVRRFEALADEAR